MLEMMKIWRDFTKENGILKEIPEGYYSDSPGFSLYSYKTDAYGKIKRDKYNIAILCCLRNTNDVEGEHSHINNSIGKRPRGWEFGDDLYAERRHRSTLDASYRHRLGFPKLFHYDVWLVDIYQTRVAEKHNIILYPNWINSSTLTFETRESFGFVSLASEDLRSKINEEVYERVSK